MPELKDDWLAALAREYNVAQFVSFSPGPSPRVRHSAVRGVPDGAVDDPADAIRALLATGAPSVNIRSFLPNRPKGNPFEYGLTRVDDAAARLRALAADGYLTILNETVDTHDGGVSGAGIGDVVEFVPGDTPRGVERSGVASLPRWLAFAVLECVYGITPELPDSSSGRVEFSVHPVRAGLHERHSIVWEYEPGAVPFVEPNTSWPHHFSRFLGDKAYGLVLAHSIGLPVPRSTVVSRRVAPFAFGRPTGTGDIWSRPCPAVPQPGLYDTYAGWVDPTGVLVDGETADATVMSMLAQEAVPAAYSGATRPVGPGQHEIEGVAGQGGRYMLGLAAPTSLPTEVQRDVSALLALAEKSVGVVRMEWVHDGTQAWVLQMHRAGDADTWLSAGEPENGWLEYAPADGLDALRALLRRAVAESRGIRVTSPVGVTSHVGELLREAGVPATLSR